MSLLAEPSTRFLGLSLNDISTIAPSDDDESDKEIGETLSSKLGPLRRSFSSIKRRKKNTTSTKPVTQDSNTLQVRPVSPHLIPYGYSHGSPASDLCSKRGVFNRRHYGSVEYLSGREDDNVDRNSGRFRVESGDRDPEEEPSPLHSPLHLENPESETRWYFRYFLGRFHRNYVGSDLNKEPFIISVIVSDANNHGIQQYRAILWVKTGAQRHCIKYNPGKPLTIRSILSHFSIYKTEKGPQEIADPEIQSELLILEEQESCVNFKFGVIYCREGQTSDDEMFSNEHGSEAFEKFIDILGDRIRLKGWDKFRAGLDVKNDTTGTESIFTVYEGHEIMFHVSTLLPYTPDNRQQVERKRHVGNDIMNIVFVDDCPPDRQPSFRPAMMKTHFTHIFLVVSYVENFNAYRLSVYSDEAVPLFGPCLPSPSLFKNHEELKNFLIVKLINGEKAAFNVPVFAQKRQRTLDMLIRDIYEDHIHDVLKITIVNRFSDIITDCNPNYRLERRHANFIRYGESLRPNSQSSMSLSTTVLTTNFIKKEPWEPQLCYGNLYHSVVCGDSWGSRLVVSTETSGTMIFEECFSPRMIFDKSLPIKQMSVIEELGLLLFRTDKYKDGGKMYVFKLLEFEGLQNEYSRSKTDCRNHRIEKSKGCHLYALSHLTSGHLRMVICVGKRLLLYSWKHSTAWSAWCPTVDILDAVDGFAFVRELQAQDSPNIITLINGSSNCICVGYKNQYDLIDEANGITHQIYQVNSSKVNMISAIDLYEDEEPELLLCYDHISHFQKLRESNKQEFDFRWNYEPKTIVCAFPYVMAFTPDTIEIRLVINGNLVHTLVMPDLLLLTSKHDIYFVSSADTSPVQQIHPSNMSPLPSANSVSSLNKISQNKLNIYKIPMSNLIGHLSSVKESGSLTPPGLNTPPPSAHYHYGSGPRRQSCQSQFSIFR